MIAFRCRLVIGVAVAAVVLNLADASVAGADPPTTYPSGLTVMQDSAAPSTLDVHVDSTAAAVQFEFDSYPFGPQVPTTNGGADLALDTLGYANGDHSVSAVDCNDDGCNTVGPSQPVTVTNDAPTITAPNDGAAITGPFTVTADAPGDGLEFLLDGDDPTFVQAAPYSLTYSDSLVTPGQHTITVVQCNADGSQCDGGSSSIAVTSELDPKIDSLSPNPFSPNHDGTNDSTKLTYTLADTEHVMLMILDAHGTTVRGPGTLGDKSAGTHTWPWNGLTHDGTPVPDGTYRFVLDTSAEVNGVAVTGHVSESVVLDRTAPTLRKLTGVGTTFYPRHDGYLDTFTPTVTLGEPARLTLAIRTAAGRPVQTISALRSAGVRSLTWNGGDGHGHYVAAGAYHWQLSAQDAAGNISHTAVRSVTVSAKQLVAKSITITRNGAAAYHAASTASCAETSTGLSSYAHGLWLANTCTKGSTTEFAIADYRVTVPAATRYDRIGVQAGGYATHAPTGLSARVLRPSTGRVDVPAYYRIGSAQARWYALGSVAGAGHVGAHRSVTVAIAVDNFYAPCAFDIAQIRVVVHYSVLR